MTMEKSSYEFEMVEDMLSRRDCEGRIHGNLTINYNLKGYQIVRTNRCSQGFIAIGRCVLLGVPEDGSTKT
jgi:hypothetical protein